MYLNSMVSELKPRSPNSHVSPSNGSITTEALIPAFTFSICFLSCINFVLIIRYITKINTTALICIKEQKNQRIYILTLLSLIAQCKLIRIPKCGKIFACLIANPRFWNPGFGSRHPESCKGLESRIQVPLTRNLQKPQCGIHNPKKVLDFLL